MNLNIFVQFVLFVVKNWEVGGAIKDFMSKLFFVVA